MQEKVEIFTIILYTFGQFWTKILKNGYCVYGRSHKIASGEHYSHHVSPSIAQNYTMLSYKKIPLKYFISHIDSLYHEFYIKIIFDVLILCLLTAKYSCSGFLELCIFWQSLEVTLEIFFKTLILPVIFFSHSYVYV